MFQRTNILKCSLMSMMDYKMMFTRAGAAADFSLDFHFFAEGGWHTELKKDVDIVPIYTMARNYNAIIIACICHF